MGFLLIDRPNPNGNHYYSSRRERVLAAVVHITAGAEDLDALNDISAENVAHYAATTDRDVSWHTGSDTDSWIDLLPSAAVAWHATDYNGCTIGHEISKRTTDWRNVPTEWKQKTLRMAALGPDGKSGLRRKALELGIPFRWATKAELDHARATGGAPVGFITHAELQWEDRRDPGYVTENGRVVDTFPRDEFMQLLNQTQQQQQQEETDMRLIKGDQLPEVWAVTFTGDGVQKRHVRTEEEKQLLISLSGQEVHTVEQWKIDVISTESAIGGAVWNYNIPVEDSDTPSAFRPAHRVVAGVYENVADVIADVDEEALAAALAAHGIGGASPAEVKQALAEVLRSVAA